MESHPFHHKWKVKLVPGTGESLLDTPVRPLEFGFLEKDLPLSESRSCPIVEHVVGKRVVSLTNILPGPLVITSHPVSLREQQKIPSLLLENLFQIQRRNRFQGSIGSPHENPGPSKRQGGIHRRVVKRILAQNGPTFFKVEKGAFRKELIIGVLGEFNIKLCLNMSVSV